MQTMSWLRSAREAFQQQTTKRNRRPCPICHGSNCTVFDESRPDVLLICHQCRHLFWKEFPSYEQLKAYYRDNYSEGHHQTTIQAGNREYYRNHIEELVTARGKPKNQVSLVDYGCSIPILIEEAKKSGVRTALGVDYDAAARAYALEHQLDMMTPEDFTTSVPANTVDLIRFSHVLEHLVEPVQVVATAVDKLNRGGILYITQPNFPVFRVDKANYQLKDSVYPSHLHFFSALSLSQLLSRFPLRIIRLFSHTNGTEALKECQHLLDLPYAESRLGLLKDKGDAAYGSESNYPTYCGQNSYVLAVKE